MELKLNSPKSLDEAYAKLIGQGINIFELTDVQLWKKLRKIGWTQKKEYDEIAANLKAIEGK